MAEPPVIQRTKPRRVIEGTPREIAAHLAVLEKDTKLMLIIPEEASESRRTQDSTDSQQPHAGMTFAEILAPLQQDFEATGMTDEELGEFIDKACSVQAAWAVPSCETVDPCWRNLRLFRSGVHYGQ